jgi:hypothetical protein
MQQSPFERLSVPRIVKKFPAVSTTRRFFSVFPSAFLLPLSKARCVQFLPFCFFTSLFNVTVPSNSGSSRWSLSFQFHYKNPRIICFAQIFFSMYSSHSSVSSVTSLWKVRARFRSRTNYFSLFQNVQTGFAAHQVSWCFSGDKTAGS